MEKVRIITDSASDMPVVDREGLTVLPLSIHFGDEEFLDGVTISHEEFYNRLTGGRILPKTSLVSPGAFSDAYDAAKKAGESVVVITIAAKLSGTYQSAVLAAEGRENVYVIDSDQATVAEQIQVLYALQLAEQGKTAAEIRDIIEAEKKNVRLVALLETLEYLHRGGRISRTVAVLGTALSIKPMMYLEEGEIHMFGKARGMKQGFAGLVKRTEEVGGIDFARPFLLGYTGVEDDELQAYIIASGETRYGWEKEVPVSSVGATIGTHVGPGAVLQAFYARKI